MDSGTTPLPSRVAAPSKPARRRKSPFRRPPGRPPDHGATMLTRVLRGVALRRTREELLAHLGGETEATVPERILIDEVAKARIICASVGSWLLERESLATPSGDLLSAVEAHARLLNQLAKVLKLLGLKRAAREVTVADEIAALHAQIAKTPTPGGSDFARREVGPKERNGPISSSDASDPRIA